MSLTVTTHLNFRGNARAALAFYQAVFGGKISIVSYRDAGNLESAAELEHVMWGQVAADNGFRIMAFDVPSGRPYHAGENAVFVAVHADTAQELTQHWAALADGAAILQPLAPSAWSPLYGMLQDRFGVTWVLSVPGANAAA